MFWAENGKYLQKFKIIQEQLTVTHTKVKCVLSNGPEDNVPAGHERMQNNI